MKHWELYKDLLAHGLLAFLALFYLGHLGASIFIGPVTVGEPNQALLWTDIVVLIGITVLAVERFIRNMPKQPKGSYETKNKGF